MPAIQGILETALYVHDLSIAAGFYRGLFACPTLFDSDRLIALDIAGRSVLLLFLIDATQTPQQTSGGVIPGHGGSGSIHLAFAIAASDLRPWRERLESLGIAIESEVSWPAGGHSLYFRDADQHLVELITPGVWATY